MKKRFPLYDVALVFVILVAAVVHAVNVGRLAKGLPRPKPPAYTQSPLVAAILRRDSAGVERLLRKGADPNVRYGRQHPGSIIPGVSQLSHGPTPLMIAALGGNAGVYWDFYEYQGLEDHHGQWDNPIIVTALLAHGADPNAHDEQGWTPLLCASVNGNVNIARCLSGHGADVNEKLQGNETVLMDAAKRGNLPLVKLFLFNGASVGAQDDQGTNALLAACDADEHSAPRENAALVQLLIERGADVNLLRSNEYPSALMTAVYSRRPLIVQLLLMHGAHVNVTNYKGMTAMMLVPRILTWRDLAILNLLVANGSKINAASYDGNTALTWAADKDDLRTVRFLLARGADVNAVNRGGHTALWFAANNGNAVMFNLLRSHGATPQGGSGRGEVLPGWGTGLGNYDIQGLR